MSGVQRILVTSSHFRAGIFLEDGRCFAAAPALEWTLGQPIGELNTYFKRRRWRVEVQVAPPPRKKFCQEPEEEADEELETECNPPDRQLTLGI